MAGQLTLGEVVFADFEIPDHIAVGGKQDLVIHRLPGGGRVVDAMGADDAPIRWSGIFSGDRAADRARGLDRLRRSGVRQNLSWSAWRYTVVVQQFEAKITNDWWIPYQIEVCVVASEAIATPDWLERAEGPALTVALLGVAALETAIGEASIGLGSSNIGQAISASGMLAQYVTARAYGLFAG